MRKTPGKRRPPHDLRGALVGTVSSSENLTQGANTIFDRDLFKRNVVSTVFHNAPAGLKYPGDPGFPPGTSGLTKKWWNFSPRLGVAWDVNGDGRTAVRSSYPLNYDFPTGEFFFLLGAPPFGNRLPSGSGRPVRRSLS